MVNENGNEQLPPATSVSMTPSIKELAVALIKVQAELPTIPKEKTAKGEKFSYTYADLATIMPAVLQVLTKHDLGIVQSVGQNGNGGSTLTTMLLHASGEWLSDTQLLLLVKNDPQAQGSAITYGRRYAIMALLGLVADEDDDANAASETPEPRAPVLRSTAKPAQRRPAPAATTGAQNVISEAQIRMLRAMLTEKFGKDERAQVEGVQAILPNAVNEAGTEIHLSKITKADASTLIDGLGKLKPKAARANDDGDPGPPPPDAGEQAGEE